MKTNSVDILSALNSDEVGFFFLVHLAFNTNFYLTTLPYELIWNGNTYRPEQELINLEAPRATTVVDRQAYKLKLSGIDPVMNAEVENGIVHLPVTIKMGFVVDGVALTGLSDLMHVYSGSVASAKKSISEDTQSINIECSAPLSSLDAKSTLFTTRDAIKALDATDTSFDQIFEGSSEFSLKWGKS
jgi:hypothetical protein